MFTSRAGGRQMLSTQCSAASPDGPDAQEPLDGAIITTDAVAMLGTVCASDRIPFWQVLPMLSVFVLSWVLVSFLRGDYGDASDQRKYEWTWGPVGSVLITAAATWLVWTPIVIVIWSGLCITNGVSLGDANYPSPAGWAPPSVEIVEAALIILPIFRGLQRGLSRPWW